MCCPRRLIEAKESGKVEYGVHPVMMEGNMNNTNSNERFWRATALALIFILVGAVIYMGYAVSRAPAAHSNSQAASQNADFRTNGFSPNAGNPYWVADLVDKALPFVVNIHTESKPKVEPANPNGRAPFKQLPNGNGNGGSNNGQDPFEWFRQQFPEMNVPNGPGYQMEQPTMEGIGSGFIVSNKGYVVTNAHVVEGMDQFTVTLNDGKEYKGKLIGADKLKDIAVLKIEAPNLVAAPLGDSDKVRIGEPAIAIGSPFGLEATVTEGIISTTARDPKELQMPTDVRRVHKLLQTDAPINQGNSGGPLLNANGEVIGVNQAIIPYGSGIGFAIPVNEVKSTIDQLIKTGKAVYPGIGVTVQDVTKDNHEELKVDQAEGAYVVQLNQNGPGDRAGIQPGDVILEIDGIKIKTGDELITQIQAHNVGDKVTMLLSRSGRKDNLKKVAVVLGELDQSELKAGE
jgi:serine protease Do